MFISNTWKTRLATMPAWFVSVYAAVCSFSVYFCMYAFRKPFTAAGFNNLYFLKIDYKVWLVSAQLVGYMLSKFYGIRFIAGMQPNRRANTIIILIVVAWIMLLFFRCPVWVLICNKYRFERGSRCLTRRCHH